MNQHVYAPAIPWMRHQMEEIGDHWSDPARALFWETGTGKTAAVLGNFAVLLESGLIGGLVIVCPKGVRKVWAEQLGFPAGPDTKIHLSADVLRRIRTRVWSSGRAARLPTAGDGSVQVLIINVEALSSATGAYKEVQDLLNARACLFVVDESTRIKTPKSTRSKRVVELSRLATYRRILTGTPAVKSPLDLWMQFMALDWRILGHKSIFTFKNRYAIMRPLYLASRTIQVVDGFQNLDELSDRMRPYSSRILKRDCLDLTFPTYRRREVEMTPEQKKIYDDLRDVAVAELEDGRYVSAPAVITQIQRMHQVLMGWVGTEDGSIAAVPHRRIAALLEELEETDGKVIIWCNHVHAIQDIASALAPECVTYYGATSDRARAEAVESFSGRGGPRYFVANQQTAGIGLDGLQRNCSMAIYYGNSFDLEQREQSEGRINRSGAIAAPTYVDLIVPGTVDEKILYALREKIDLAAQVMRDGPREWIV